MYPRQNVFCILVHFKNGNENMVHAHQNSPFSFTRSCLWSSLLTVFHKGDLKEICKINIRTKDNFDNYKISHFLCVKGCMSTSLCFL